LRTGFLFFIFWKDLPVWWEPSGFWKLLSSLENNFHRPEVLIISLVFFQFLILFLQNMDWFFKHMKVPYRRRPSRFSTSLKSERPRNLLLYFKKRTYT
jgi:hypothetical protein